MVVAFFNVRQTCVLVSFGKILDIACRGQRVIINWYLSGDDWQEFLRDNGS